jgi:hypothetical protein
MTQMAHMLTVRRPPGPHEGHIKGLHWIYRHMAAYNDTA